MSKYRIKAGFEFDVEVVNENKGEKDGIKSGRPFGLRFVLSLALIVLLAFSAWLAVSSGDHQANDKLLDTVREVSKLSKR